MVQMAPPRSAGDKIRLTLVRTFDSFFPKKLTSERYLQLKTVPILQYYKIVLSNFSQSEYQSFKNDFSGDVSFLTLTHHDIPKILSIANDSRFYLCGFRSGGAGQIKLKSTADVTGQNYLYNEIRNAIINGILPYSLTLSNGKIAVELRTDFNFILPQLDSETLGLAYDIFDSMLKEKDESMNRIATSLIPRTMQQNSIQRIEPIQYSCSSEISVETILREASTGFIPGRIEESLLGHAFYLFSGSLKSPFCRITVSGKNICLIATPGSSVDNITLVMDNLSALGKVVNDSAR